MHKFIDLYIYCIVGVHTDHVILVRVLLPNQTLHALGAALDVQDEAIHDTRDGWQLDSC